MRFLFLCLLALVPATAQAQVGLTPEAQVNWLCTRAMNFRAQGDGDSTAIAAACGTQVAVAARLAAGRTGLDAVKALVAAARAARDTRLQSRAP